MLCKKVTFMKNLYFYLLIASLGFSCGRYLDKRINHNFDFLFDEVDESEKKCLDLSIFSENKNSSNTTNKYYKYEPEGSEWSYYIPNSSKTNFYNDNYTKSKLHIAFNTEFFRKFANFDKILEFLHNEIIKIIEKYDSFTKQFKVGNYKFLEDRHNRAMKAKKIYGQLTNNDCLIKIMNGKSKNMELRKNFIDCVTHQDFCILSGFFSSKKIKVINVDKNGWFSPTYINFDNNSEHHLNIIYRSIAELVRPTWHILFTLYSTDKKNLKNFIDDIERFLSNLEEQLKQNNMLKNDKSLGIDKNILEHDGVTLNKYNYCYFRDGGNYYESKKFLGIIPYKSKCFYKNAIFIKTKANAKSILNRINFVNNEIAPIILP